MSISPIGRDLRDASVYYVLALGLAIVVAWLARGSDQDELLALYMFTPFMAILLLRLLSPRRPSFGAKGLGLARPGFSAWPFAILVPPVLLGLVTLASVATGLVALDLTEVGNPAWAFPAALAVHLALGCVLAFGEEIGWRGFLLERLRKLGPWRAMLLTGFLHGAWHLPVMLMTPHYHSEGTLWLVVPGFLAVLTLAGIPYGYVRLRTESVWPAVIMHAMFNEVLAQTSHLTTSVDPAMPGYLGGESGAFSIVALAVLALGISRVWTPRASSVARTP